MIKPILFVDIDGVMADSISWWIDLYNKDNGTTHKREHVTCWDTRICIKADLLPYFHNYDNVDPIPGAFKSIAWLMNKYRIVFATTGLGSNWLKRYISYAEIIVIKDKSLLRGFGLIDDNPENLDGFVGERFLLSQPWNTNRGLNDACWEEITQYLLKI